MRARFVLWALPYGVLIAVCQRPGPVMAPLGADAPSAGYASPEEPLVVARAAPLFSPAPFTIGTGQRIEGPSSPQAASTTRRVRTGDVTLENLETSVRLDNAAAIVLGQILPGARRCYQRALDAGPSKTGGKLVVIVHADASGKVVSALVSRNTGLTAALASCVAEVAERANFGTFDLRGADGAAVTVSFRFTAALASVPSNPPVYDPYF